MTNQVSPSSTIGFLGPPGTFTESALRTEADLAGARLEPLGSFAQILQAVAEGAVDYGFLALENSIEGSVLVALDQLIFERDLLILREVQIPVTQSLLGVKGTSTGQIKRVLSFPHALAQCRGWLRQNIPGAAEVPASSTADAARLVAEEADPTAAAIGTGLAAERYGLEVIQDHIEDYPDNATRFVLLGRQQAGIPAPTGHDKTSIVCFQSDNRPGNLHRILGQFSARDLNLNKLESRPTKSGLGDYCFVIDFEGHVDDEIISDCLRDLHTSMGRIKFLGSYPAAGQSGDSLRRDAHAAWEAADQWISGIRAMVSEGKPPTGDQ